MAHQSLYRKWRPQTFGDMVGQEHVARTLANAVASGRTTHAYLFTGPRGTGKTSAARLLAKALNCTNRTGGEPCDQCASCVAIRDGRSLDVTEIDGASNRGIDDIRQLRERVGTAPAIGPYRFYIIDEVHQLTEAAFNALLKTLEEPPPHIVFILATTDVHKVQATIVSRCQHFSFHRLAPGPLRELVQRVAATEQLAIEPDALSLLIDAADGGGRDALSLLDQAVAYGGSTIDTALLTRMLGLVPTIAINQFCEHLAARNTGAALALIAQLAGEGAGFRQFNQQVIQRLRTMLVEHSATVDRNAAWDTPRLLAAIRTLAAIDFSNRLSALPQLLVELAAVEICTRSAPAPSVSQGLPVAVQVPTDAAAPASAPPRPQPTYTRPAAPPVRSSGNGGSNFRRGAPQASAPPPARPATGYTPARDAPPDDDDFERTPGVMPNVAPEQRRLWERGIGLLRQKNPRAQGLCNSTRFAGFQDGALQLVPNHSFVRDQLSDPKFREIVEQVMAEVFGQPVTLRFLSASEVPADGAKATVPAKPADPALPDVASNPTVLAALDVFGATIKEVIPPGSPAPRDGHSR